VPSRVPRKNTQGTLWGTEKTPSAVYSLTVLHLSLSCPNAFRIFFPLRIKLKHAYLMFSGTRPRRNAHLRHSSLAFSVRGRLSLSGQGVAAAAPAQPECTKRCPKRRHEGPNERPPVRDELQHAHLPQQICTVVHLFFGGCTGNTAHECVTGDFLARRRTFG